MFQFHLPDVYRREERWRGGCHPGSEDSEIVEGNYEGRVGRCLSGAESNCELELVGTTTAVQLVVICSVGSLVGEREEETGALVHSSKPAMTFQYNRPVHFCRLQRILYALFQVSYSSANERITAEDIPLDELGNGSSANHPTGAGYTHPRTERARTHLILQSRCFHGEIHSCPIV